MDPTGLIMIPRPAVFLLGFVSFILFELWLSEPSAVWSSYQEVKHDRESPSEEPTSSFDDMELSRNPTLDSVAVSTLPRTSQRPYNEFNPDEKHVLYTASGGFNNQIRELVAGLILAKATNRTLLVPPAGTHSSLYRSYLKLKQKDVIPMDHCIDFQHLEKVTGVKMIALNITIGAFHRNFLQSADERRVKGDLLSSDVEHASVIFAKKLLAMNIRNSKKVKAAILSKTTKPVAFIYGPFYSLQRIIERGSIFEEIRPSPFLMNFAKRLTDVTFGENEPYNAMHVRLGDFFHFYRTNAISAAPFLANALLNNWNISQGVYIASESGYEKYFAPLMTILPNAKRAVSLLTNPKTENLMFNFAEMLPSSHIRQDTFGIVEQLICARAPNFVGTFGSTFSKEIEYYQDLYPESNHSFKLAAFVPTSSHMRVIKKRLGGSVASTFRIQYRVPDQRVKHDPLWNYIKKNTPKVK